MSSYTGFAEADRDELPSGGTSGDVLALDSQGQPDWFTPQFEEAHNDLAVSALTGVEYDAISLDLGAGVWEVEANIIFELAGATVTQMEAAISLVSETLPADNSVGYIGTQYTTTTVKDSLSLPKKRVTLSEAGTVYLVVRNTYSAGSVGALVSMSANKVG